MSFYVRLPSYSVRLTRNRFPKMSEKSFTILYGSQTGQAKAIAEEIFEQAEEYDLKAKILCLSTTDKKFSIEKEKVVVFVVSTTGDGDPPDTVTKFWRRIKKKTLGSTYLSGLHYALLGLGDTNYTNFCNCSKNLNSRLLDLGATHFYPPGFADDAVGLEVVVEPWIDGLWPELMKELNSSRHNKDEDTPAHSKEETTSEEKPSQSSVGHDDPLTVNIKNGDKSDSMSHELSQNGLSVDITVNKHHISDEAKAIAQDSKDLTPSLRISTPPLSESDLSIPILPAPYLSIMFTDEVEENASVDPWQGGVEFPGSASSVIRSKIISATRMTKDDAVKIAYCLTVDTCDVTLDYNPGDSFGVICPNNENEVEELISRLGYKDRADRVFKLEAIEETGSKKRAKGRPDYIPLECTIRQALICCLEFRAVPRKAFLRVLCEYTSDSGEKRRLQELCSKEGASDYSIFIREPHVSFIDILNAFPSCGPPFERLLEHLPRLLPRPYSVACSPLENPKTLRFVFNIVKFPEIRNVRSERLGVCTGWLQRRSKNLSTEDNSSEESIESTLKELSINCHPELNIIRRNPTGFHLPNDVQCPVIMIGPGTGVAPFVGFLQHRRHLQRLATHDTKFGATWLFYGCRHKERDFLFREELMEFETNGVLTKLVVSFSRDVAADEENKLPKYVQDNIKIWGDELCDLIYNCGAFIFVCGDAKNMAKNVLDTFIDVLQNAKGLSHEEAKKDIWKLRQEHRYVEDVWT